MLSGDYKGLLDKWVLREKTHKRDVEDEILPFISRKNVVFLFGPRRAGKSVVARRLLERMPKGSNTRYVNLEDPKLINSLNTDLMESFAEGLEADDTIVFDEVQLIPGWEKWARKAVDTRQCQIIVTGSSAKLLSGEFASSLGGRDIGFQILPFSFAEFRRITKKGLDEYLKTGGYPEVVLNPEKKEKLLESYFELALIKDIVTRYQVRDSAALRNMAFYLLTNSGKQVSLKGIRSVLGLSYDTIKQFLDYLESAFLVFQVPFFSYSMKESLTRARKVYAFDLGMQQYASRSFTEDKGRLAEAAAAIELKRRQFEIFYWKNSKETDLVAKKKTKVMPINVCFAETIPAREKDGLIEFCKKNRAKKATILYAGKTAKTSQENIEIETKNLQEWLLEKNSSAE
ncbi:MAG: ATP-binding protein [Candidatus Diapherotrites archaeon]|nr:ATP-binding protein [Candidatus Diapherotrites archaeon]